MSVERVAAGACPILPRLAGVRSDTVEVGRETGGNE